MPPRCQVLAVTAGGQQFAIPIETVAEVTRRRAGPAEQGVVRLAEALGLAHERQGEVQLELATARGRYTLAVETVGRTEYARALPLPDLLDQAGQRLPFSSVVPLAAGPALLLDVERLAGAGQSNEEASRTARTPDRRKGQATGENASSVGPAGPGAVPGGPLLICTPGPYRLRQRTLALGFPLTGVAAVGHYEGVVPVPRSAAPVAGVAIHGERAVPVLHAPDVLGLPPAPWTPQFLVVVDTGRGPAALAVEHAAGTERPLHWAPASVLAPFRAPAIVGAIPRRERWTAVLDPALIT
jgi:chemotaxis signal transduction protein